MIYLKLILYMMWGFKVHFPAYVCLVVLASFTENTVLSPFNCFYTFLKNPLSICVRFYFWILYSDWVTYLSILTPHCLDTEIWNQLVDVLQLCSSVSVCLGYEYSAFPDEFQNHLVNSYKKPAEILIRTALTLQINLQKEY